LRVDPIGLLPFGTNGELNHLYNYASSDPINKTDPLGLFWNWNGNLFPGSGPQDFECSSIAKGLNKNKCTKECCVEHDKCYAKYGCNASSWVGGVIGVIPSPGICQYCNAKAELCMIINWGEDDDCACF
jgi:hypothetical protein